MPRHDTPEAQAEIDAHVEGELRALMAAHGVTHMLKLPREVFRGECVRLAHASPAVHHRILLERDT